MADHLDATSIESLQQLIEKTALHRHLGFRIVDLDVGRSCLSISSLTGGAAARFDGSDQAHGGAIAALMDTAATVLCVAALQRPVPTINLRIDYLRPAAGGEMIAKATAQKIGRSHAVVDVEARAEGKIVALARCIIATRRHLEALASDAGQTTAANWTPQTISRCVHEGSVAGSEDNSRSTAQFCDAKPAPGVAHHARQTSASRPSADIAQGARESPASNCAIRGARRTVTLRPQIIALRRKLNSVARASRDRRWHGVREKIRARALARQLNGCALAAGETTASAARRLAGAGQQ